MALVLASRGGDSGHIYSTLNKLNPRFYQLQGSLCCKARLLDTTIFTKPRLERKRGCTLSLSIAAAIFEDSIVAKAE